MPALARFWALVCHLPHDPLDDVILSAWIRRHELACLFRDVEHDGAGFEYRKRTTPVGRFMVDQRGHPIVRIDAEKMVSELIALADIALNDVVFEAALLELNRDFLAVRRWPIM